VTPTAVFLAERIQHFDASLLEVSTVSSCNSQPVMQGVCSNQSILDRHGLRRMAERRKQSRPTQSSCRLKAQTLNSFDAMLKPTLQSSTTPSNGQEQNTELNLSEDDWINHDFRFIVPQPSHYFRVGGWFRGFAENISVDQIGHNVSVDSDSIGTK